eukprot:TRINITY_DN2973_c0_g1_i1.p1 TRINITY_DN2973_c0_g1~~TRINITY_DN2973_c0_g1_i1.p1  ORF type:complete len:491 (-),score=160.15 TRINITY_DN2973_c0_g1_i1:962-2293(-)
MMKLYQEETNPTRKDLFKAKMTEMLDHAESAKARAATKEIKQEEQKIQEKEEKQEQKGQHMDQEDHECKILFSIDGVECYSVLGTDRECIAAGTLQLIKPSGADMHLLHLGEFEFPLTKQIPCLNTSRGYYMVPMQGNIFYGFIFPKDIPDAYLETFEALLDQICILRKRDPQLEKKPVETPASTSQELAVPSTSSQAIITKPADDYTTAALKSLQSGIVTGTQWTLKGVEAGTRLARQGIEAGGEYLKSKMAANEVPMNVHPVVKNTVSAVATATPYAVSLSKGTISALVNVAEHIGRAVGGSLSGTGIGKSMGSGTSGPRVQAAKDVGKTALYAVTNVWDSLEESGRCLLQQTNQTTVDLVNHRYGKEAADVTGMGLNAAVDAVDVMYTLDGMGVKKLAKKAAKKAGKSFAKEMIDHQRKETHDGIEMEEKKMLTDGNPTL